MKLFVAITRLYCIGLIVVSCALIAAEQQDKVLADARQAWHQNKDFVTGFNLSKTYYKAAQFDNANELIESLLSRDSLNAEQQAKLLRLQAQIMIKRNDYALQNVLLERVSKIIANLDDNSLKTSLYATLGKLKIKQFQLAQAQEYYLKAIDSAEQQKELNRVYEELGITYAQQGKFAEATEAMLKAVNIHETHNLPVPHSLYNNLGGLALYTKDWDQAIRFLTLAIENIKGDTQNKADSYSNLGNAYLQKKDEVQAIKYYRLSLDIAQKLGKEDLGTLNNLAYLLLGQGKHDSALASFKKIERYYRNHDDKKSLGIAKKNIGETYMRMGENVIAADYFESAYVIYTHNEYIPKLLELYPVMIDNYKTLANFERALHLASEFKVKSDNAINVESNAKIAELQSAFELEKKSKELAESQNEVASLAHKQAVQEKAVLELELAKQAQQRSIYLLASVVIILIVAGIFLVRINKLRANTNHALRQKNDEIERNHQELQDLNQKLVRQSTEDVLTGLKNRRFVDQLLPREQARMLREIKGSAFEASLVIMLDIDHFKHINDSYGHAAGDKVLQVFADVLRENARSTDMQVRWGGEEFLWYCPQTTFSDGEHLCQRVRAQLKELNIDVGEGIISPTCSFGFVSFPAFGNPETDWENSLKVADAALYRAKELGRDRFVGAQVSLNSVSSGSGEFDIEKLIKEKQISFVEWSVNI